MIQFNIYKKIALFGFFSLLLSACTTEDLDPSTEQNKPVDGGITSVTNVYGLLKGAYSTLTGADYYGRDYIINNEVRSDDAFSNGNSGRFTTEASLTYNANTGFFWDEAYAAIASANIIIVQDPAALSGDLDYLEHLKGQAYAIRALAHFDLLKQYGQINTGGGLGVPYVTDFKGEDLFPARNTIEENITMIFEDLDTAFGLMNEDYYDPSKEFISKFAAKAIESRVATYFGRWERVISASEAVINSGHYSIISASDFVGSFGADSSSNSIFELAFNSTDNRGINGLAYIYRTTGGGSYGDVQALDGIIDIYDEEDVRLGILGYEGNMLRNIGKYPDNQGYDNVGVIRYEEVILNYAEALFETGRVADALVQINLITSNRNAAAYTSLNKADFLAERQKEFIFEGIRFDDLMRTKSPIEKVSPQQNFLSTIPYGDNRLAWPIPQAEVDANSNIEQNNGY